MEQQCVEDLGQSVDSTSFSSSSVLHHLSRSLSLAALFFRVQLSGDHLGLFKPDPTTASSATSLLSSALDDSDPAAPPPNSITRWLRCP